MLGVCTKGTGSGIRGLENTAGVGSLIGSIEPVTCRIRAIFPFAPLEVEEGILGAVFGIFVVER